MHKYKTLSSYSEGIYKEKGSKFIGIAFQCDSTSVFKNQLNKFKKDYHDANHHCFAYRLKVDGSNYRYNDDGEPNNSAGKPILGQIDHFNLTNTAIVVIRYFGGTKLGVGGLIKAYREAAKEALLNNNIIEKEITSTIKISFSYSEMNTIMGLIKEHKLKILDQNMYLNCEITLEFPINKKAELKSYLDQFTNIKKSFLE